MKKFATFLSESYLASVAVKKLLSAKRSLDNHSGIPLSSRASDHTEVKKKLMNDYEAAKAAHARLTQ